MAECPSLPTCPFFNEKMPIESALGKIYKRKYCLGDNSTCARWMVAQALGKQNVPGDLYPNMREEAEKLIHP